MKRRSFLVLSSLPAVAVATVLAVYLTAPTQSADASRPAPAGATNESTFTATPCPTDKAPDTFHGSGCGTITPTPTSVRVAPMITINFSVNGKGELNVQPGDLLSYEVILVSNDERHLTGDFTVYQQGAEIASGHCAFAPEATCFGKVIVTTAKSPGTVTGMFHLSATVDGCGLCPDLSEDRSVLVHVGAASGDFNCDGSINSIDAELILQLTADLIQPFDCTGAGDANADGSTNSIDATLVLQYVAGLINTFPLSSPLNSQLPKRLA